jgi:G3E family GTPase
MIERTYVTAFPITTLRTKYAPNLRPNKSIPSPLSRSTFVGISTTNTASIPTATTGSTTSKLQVSTMSGSNNDDTDTSSSTITDVEATVIQGQPSPNRIPVVLLSGFLGSGKTSALQHLLHNTDHQWQLGVLVNDVASINIDAKFIAMNTPPGSESDTGSSSSTTTTTTTPSISSSSKNNSNYDVIELQNGCACCSLQDDFLLSIERMIQNRQYGNERNNNTKKPFDAIIVELTGVADPAAIQNNWRSIMTTKSIDESFFPDLAAHCERDLRVVTLVDTCTFGTDYMTWDVIGERPVWVTTDNVDECDERRKVAELLVEQVEAANVVLINKVDIATQEQQTVTQLMIKALNDKAEIIPVRYGKVLPEQLLGKSMSIEIENEAVATNGKCTDAKCTDPTHSHSHHNHDHATTSECSDASHTHSHDHPAALTCDDPTCTDASHSHHHDHNHAATQPQQRKNTSTDAMGFVNFVYKANRPFHTQRIMSALSQWPVPIKETLDLGTLQLNDNAPFDIDGTMVAPGMYENNIHDISPFIGVLRSKGFCWFAPQKWTGTTHDAWRHDTAMYWSHAGRQFGISTAGKWWATMSSTQMAKYFIGNEQEYDRMLREDFVSEEFGDRRQEIVFIGTQLNQEDITATLDACLLTDKEMDYYRQKLRNFMDEKAFTSKTRSSMSDGLFNVETINHTDV